MLIDINSRSPGHAGNLSNLANHPFIMDGIYYGSMEGFIQHLRVEDTVKAAEVAAMHGIKAKSQGKVYPIKNNTLYYKGKPFNRFSPKYSHLLAEAYDKCFAQNESFQVSIYMTRNDQLCHSIGKSDAYKTLLTEEEFLFYLNLLKVQYSEYLKLNYMDWK
jgi:predicted NAD-dependent protein-ADP-ribosyltransferase YbiA (DUF1768 family)